MEDFDKAIEDTIIALNTGVLRTRDGSILKKADGKSSVVNIEWREKLNTIWRKHHLLIDQTLLSGIVMLNAIIIIVHAATAHISRSSNSRPTGTTADDFGLHMINCHIWHLLSMLPATADKALGRAHEPRRGYHCLIYQVVSKCALRE